MNTSGKSHSVELNVIDQHQINIPSGSPQSLPLNLPSKDLLEETRGEDYRKVGFLLYEASMKGDWELAKGIFNEYKELVRFSINANYETALHVAVYQGNTLFVENLVTLMEKKDMELQNSSSNTALCLAAVAGNVYMAEIMVTKHKALLDIAGSEGKMPLYMAALSGKRGMTKYLYQNSARMTGDFWTDENRGCVLLACVEAGLFDVALEIVKDQPQLATNCGGSVLGLLARKPQAFGKDKRSFYDKWINNQYKGFVDEENIAFQFLKVIWANIEKLPNAKIDEILRGPTDELIEDVNQTTSEKATTSKIEVPKEVTRKYSLRLLFVAAKMGNIIFIVELIRRHPERVLQLNDNNQSIFHVAVSHRHDYIYSLLYQIGSLKDSVVNLEDKDGNNMLHLVGILRETTMSDEVVGTMSNEVVGSLGALIQMRHDLIWFQEVKAILPLSLREKKNTAGQSPYELFTENHKVVASIAEEWVKKISSELMLVAALLITISFAANITFAGAYNQLTGLPTFYKRRTFVVFILASGTSFISATLSIFCVFSIIISRYGKRDLMTSIPKKMYIVIASLSVSMTNMMVAFFCNFCLLWEDKNQKATGYFVSGVWSLSHCFSLGILYFVLITLGFTKEGINFHVQGIMY